MAYDLKNLTAEAGSLEVDLEGETLEFFFRKPNSYELMDFHAEASVLFEKFGFDKGEPDDDEPDEPATMEVRSSDYQPVLTFCQTYITRCLGLESAGKPQEWNELSSGMKDAILKGIGPLQAMELLGQITKSANLSRPVKNG
jgi:hypothetical protein